MRDDSWNLTQVRSRGTACEHFPGHFARYVITGPWWLFGPNPVSPAGQKLEPFQSKVTLDPALALAEIVAGPVILLQVIYRGREPIEFRKLLPDCAYIRAVDDGYGPVTTSVGPNNGRRSWRESDCP